MIDDEIKLINETLNGKIDSFGILVEKYQNKMFNLAYKITHDADCSKDITQDAFIKAYNNLRNFDSGKKFFSWIYRITLNESLNAKKRFNYSESINDEMIDHYSTQENFEKSEISNEIEKAVNRLEEKYKTLILLKHYQDLSYEEISEILNLPIGKVKSRLYIARENLKTILEKINK